MASPAAYYYLVIAASRHIVNFDLASIPTVVVVLNISADAASVPANICVGRLDLFGHGNSRRSGPPFAGDEILSSG